MTSTLGIKKIQHPNGTNIATLDSSGSIAFAGASTVAGTLGVTGTITGTLATAAQTNITSVGTLSSVTVNGTGTSNFTSTATSPVQINGTSIPTLTIRNSTTPVELQMRATTGEGLVRTSTNHPLVFAVNASEKVRIDGSGNLLVGGTTTNHQTGSSQEQLSYIAGGYFAVSRSSNDVAFFNRQTSDGPIITLRKDGTTVGSIGYVATGQYIQGETDHSGIRFGGNQLIPFRNGADTDATTDLGASGVRFKNIYASNTITSTKTQGGTAFYASTAGSYIQVNGSSSNAMAFGMTGGTSSPATAASTSFGFHHWNNSSWVNPVNITRYGIAFNGDTAQANSLDDYEEGSWTLTDTSGAGLSITVYVATYTKIGNQVFFEFGIVFPTTSNGNDLKLSLPFTAKNSSDNTGGGGITVTNSGRNDTLVVIRNSSNMAVQNNLNQSASNANYSGKQLRVAGQYTAQ